MKRSRDGESLDMQGKGNPEPYKFQGGIHQVMPTRVEPRVQRSSLGVKPRDERFLFRKAEPACSAP